jgi:ribosome recycling factor
MVSFTFVEGASTKPFETIVENEMLPHIKHLEKELIKIRTGRAHPSMVEDIKISAYGEMMPLKELASITAPDAGMLIVTPWDKGLLPDIEKGIAQSDLGVAPTNDGTMIRIVLQRMSAGRREELTKTLKQRLEEAKIAIRNVRKDVHNAVRDAEKAKKVSEDYSKRLQDLIQKMTDKSIELADKTAQKKEIEIQAV